MAWGKKIKNILKKMGPGFVTGVADDDPVTLTTYSLAGAAYGYALSWLNVFITPAMIVVQEMCGRIGMLTGRGLAGVIKKYRSRRLMWVVVALLFVANTVSIGADLGIMAASLSMVLGLPILFWLLILALFIILTEVLVSYKKYVVYLKWLSLSLLAYVATALVVKQDWGAILKASLIPSLQLNMNYLMMMVAFLGATISPSLFFWQASEEVEEEISEKVIADFDQKPDGVGLARIRVMRADTVLGMVFSNLIGFFVLITTAATLYVGGITDIKSIGEVALALRPIAGQGAFLLLALGVVGVGLVSIPVLAGCVGYAVADGLDLKEGLSKKYHQARGFYRVLVAAMVLGLLMNLLGVNVIKGLYYSAIINGVISVPLIAIIISLANDSKVVGRFITSLWGRVIAWVTFGFMTLAVLLMIASILGLSFPTCLPALGGIGNLYG